LNISKILVFVPTYNEAENICPLVTQVFELGLAADMLVIDDGSPDGTGDLVGKLTVQYPNLRLLRRSGKQGIGSAHIAALEYAKSQGYSILISLDADFSHKPSDLPRLLALVDSRDIVLGTRFEGSESLEDWNPFRKGMTHLGHFLTRTLLGLPYDATGALRAYKLAAIPGALIDLIESRDYEFFFESLMLFHAHGLTIGQVPIKLPARTYGHSKMSVRLMLRGAYRLVRLSLKRSGMYRRVRYASSRPPEASEMRVAWDAYWQDKGQVRVEHSLYDVIASFHRAYLIKPLLNRAIQKAFPEGAELLHAGCGGGEVDVDVVRYASVTALDISPKAIGLYRSRHRVPVRTIIGNVFDLSSLDRRFDGVYNLGVMEHFNEEQIKLILAQFNACLHPGGKIVIFWPPVYGLSVIVLHGIHFVLNKILRRDSRLHPPEPTKIASRAQAERLLSAANFELLSMSFSIRDAFTHMVIVGMKTGELAPSRNTMRAGEGRAEGEEPGAGGEISVGGLRAKAP
jgi:glycosyltransferase involved in cell wall biosynthesis